MKSGIKFLIVVATSLFLISCQSKSKDSDKVVPAKELYAKGLKNLASEDYTKAAAEFEKVFFQHPGNPLTPDAELMQAYSLYLAGDYDDAIDVLEIFIKLHPRHKDIAYAYYLKALSNYVQISSVKLDQSKTRRAKESLEEVIQRFPGSKYAIDSALKIDLVNDHLAGKEMLIGRFYLKKKNPIAAINRFQTVVKYYDTTTHITEALYRLVESNLMLGLKVEAKIYLDILRFNYPNSKWTKLGENILE